MASVTGITAERAQRIEDASVISGTVNQVNGRLLLTKGDGTIVDAGLAKPNSPVGATIDVAGHLIFTLVDGTTVDVGAVSKASDVQIFNTSGTWTKPTNAKKVQVFVLGGGGGGAGGEAACSSASGNIASGGQGGASAGYSYGEFRASDLSASVSVTVGAGGYGGGGVSTSAGTFAGSAGGDGGLSAFGSYMSAQGGVKGKSGTNVITAQTDALGRIPGVKGGNNVAGSVIGQAYSPDDTLALFGSGGSGGSVQYNGTGDTDSNYTAGPAQNGGRTRNNPSVAGGLAGGTSALGQALHGSPGSAVSKWEGGTGGGGGGASYKSGAGSALGGNGGGAGPGCGGGGGGAAYKAATGTVITSGAGAPGGSGRVIVITFF